MEFNKEAMQARFHEVFNLVDAIEAQSRPMREARDLEVNTARERERELDAAIREVEKDLPALKDELAFLARGLGGKTGARASVLAEQGE